MPSPQPIATWKRHLSTRRAAVPTEGGTGISRRASRAPETREEGEGELLIAAQRGDTGAFDDLVRRHDRVVLGFARRLLRNPEDAQEASQEVFLRLFRNLDRLDPSRPLRPWLYRVTVNVCHDIGRRLRRLADHHSLDAAEATGELPRAPRTDDPGNRAEAREEARMVLDALATLGAQERSALVLRDLEGLSTPEVAEILGSTAGTIRSQICRARLKIHRYRQQWLQESRRGSKP